MSDSAYDHTDYIGLLDTIRDAPGDDAPRLVCADWLDEHGEAERAEFIRLQCFLFSADKRRRDYRRGLKREYELYRLLDAGKMISFAERERLQECAKSVLWERGFIELVECTASNWIKSCIELVSRHPITRVNVSGFTSWQEPDAMLREFTKAFPSITFCRFY